MSQPAEEQALIICLGLSQLDGFSILPTRGCICRDRMLRFDLILFGAEQPRFTICNFSFNASVVFRLGNDLLDTF